MAAEAWPCSRKKGGGRRRFLVGTLALLILASPTLNAVSGTIEQVLPAGDAPTGTQVAEPIAIATPPAASGSLTLFRKTDANANKIADIIEAALLQPPFSHVKLLLRLTTPMTPEQEQLLEAPGFEVLEHYRSLPNVFVRGPSSLVPALQALPFVQLIEPNYKVQLRLDTSMPQIEADWAHKELNITGTGMVVAFIDTGVDPDHPDFRPYNYSSQPPDTCDGEVQHADEDAICTRVIAFCHAIAEPCPTNPEEHVAFDDNSFGHGTHVSSISAGNGTASAGTYRGVAPNASIVMIRAFNSAGFGSATGILRGYQYVIDYNDDPTKTNISVFSHSWGCFLGCNDDGQDSLTQGLVNAQEQAGVFAVVAAGNSGPGEGSVGCPLSCAQELFAVGAVDDDDVVAWFSSRGPGENGIIKPDVVAPGVDITAARNNPTGGDYYRTLSGTSMATPHVAGAAALVKQWNSTLTTASMSSLLRDTADTLTGEEPNNNVGWGRVNVKSAINGTQPYPGQACSDYNNPTVKGYVTNISNPDQGVQGVQVTLFCRRGGSIEAQVVTDANGFYEVQVGEGNYTLQAKPPDTSFFLDKSLDSFHLENNTNITWKNVSLREGGRLTVKVINQSAANVTDILVQVADEQDPRNRHAKTTNAEGEVLFRLPIGDYAVRADGQNLSLESVELVPYFTNVSVGLYEHAAVQAVLVPPNVLQARAGPDRSVSNTTSVVFNGLGSQSYPDDFLSYGWDFGDGSAKSVKPVVEHTYSRLGTYAPTLTITNGTGAKHTDQAIIYVSEPGNWNTRAVINDPPQDESILTIETFLTQGKYPWLDITRVLVGQNATHLFFYINVLDLQSKTTGSAQYYVDFTTENVVRKTCASVNFATNVTLRCTTTNVNDAQSIDRPAGLIKLRVPRQAVAATGVGVSVTGVSSSTQDTELLSPTFSQPIDWAPVPGRCCTGQWVTRSSNERPTVAFTFTPAEPSSDQVVNFTDASSDDDGSPARWLWDFGNGFVTSRQHPLHAFSSPGCFWVKLQVWDFEGATRSTKQALRVKYDNGTLPPLEDCQATGRLRGLVLNASNVGQGVPDVKVRIYEEDASDPFGGNPAAEDVSGLDGGYLVKAKPGTYALRASPPREKPYLEARMRNLSIPDSATVTQDVLLDGAGFLKVMIKNATGQPVEAKMTVVNTTLNKTLVRFANATGDIVIKAPPGWWNVTLTANPELLLQERTHVNVNVPAFTSVEVNGTLELLPILEAEPYPRQEGEVSQALQFDASRSIAQPFAASNYTWAFGDGTTGFGVAPSHAFARFGEYQTRLNVTDTNSSWDAEIIPVYVNQAGRWNTRLLTTDATGGIPAYQDIQEVLASLDEGSAYFYLRLANLSTIVDPTEYSVNFTVPGSGNYVACAVLNATFFITIPGKCINGGVQSVLYNTTEHWIRLQVPRVTVSLENGTNVTNVQGHTVDVLLSGSPVPIDDAPDNPPLPRYFVALPTEPPVANFTFTPEGPFTTLDFIQFFDLSTDYDGDIASWDWSFGDLNTSTLKNPGHRYSSPCDSQTFVCVVTLQATDNEGNRSVFKSTTITVVPQEESE